MLIIRKYKKLQWFDFLDRIEVELAKSPDKKVYFELMDEIRMRLLESVSEGGTFKLKKPTNNLLERFKKRLDEDSSFATADDFNELKVLSESIL